MNITAYARRVLVAASFVVAACVVSGCDLEVGPPVQDVGYDHNVGPATAGTSSGTAGRRSARSTPRA